jgi:hypothetical protein
MTILSRMSLTKDVKTTTWEGLQIHTLFVIILPKNVQISQMRNQKIFLLMERLHPAKMSPRGKIGLAQMPIKCINQTVINMLMKTFKHKKRQVVMILLCELAHLMEPQPRRFEQPHLKWLLKLTKNKYSKSCYSLKPILS